MTTTTAASQGSVSRRLAGQRGLVTVSGALVLLVVAGLLFAPSSISKGALLGMLPFAAVLAIAALGQTLVVMQGGIDLSVAGSISTVIVIVTHQAYGDDSKVPMAAVTALGIALAAGLVNGYLIGRIKLNPIVATLGTNALLYAIVLQVSGGTPRQTTDILAKVAGGLTLGIPNAVFFAVLATVVTTVLVKRTVVGRRFEAVGANGLATWAAGLRVQRHQAGAYVWAQVLYCGWPAFCSRASSTSPRPTRVMSTCSRRSRRWSSAARRSWAVAATSSPPHSRPSSSPSSSSSSSPSVSASPSRPWSRPRRSPSASRSTPSTGRPSPDG
jgi:ribose/xylose/arabinose/galactoside ABC-type transport system permease subunit